MLKIVQIIGYYKNKKKSKKFIIKKLNEIVNGINNEFILTEQEILKIDEILKSKPRLSGAFLILGME